MSGRRRRIVEVFAGKGGYGESLLRKMVRRTRGLLEVSPHGRVFAPPVIEIEMRTEDARAAHDALGAGDLTAYIRHRLNDSRLDVIFPDKFLVRVVETDRARPGRPRCIAEVPEIDLAPFLVSGSEGFGGPSTGRRLPIGVETKITREWLSDIAPADIMIGNKRPHAVITIVSRYCIEIQPVPNRLTEVDGRRLTQNTVLNYREEGYRLTFGHCQLLLFWAEDLRPPPARGQS